MRSAVHPNLGMYRFCFSWLADVDRVVLLAKPNSLRNGAAGQSMQGPKCLRKNFMKGREEKLWKETKKDPQITTLNRENLILP